MLQAGLLLLIAACALTLSALQGWALRGGKRFARHVVAWGIGTVLVSVLLTAAWQVARHPRAPFGTIPLPQLTVLHWVVGLGVAAALGAGAVQARRLDRRAEPAGDSWLARAVAQGVSMLVVTGAGLALLVLVLLGTHR